MESDLFKKDPCTFYYCVGIFFIYRKYLSLSVIKYQISGQINIYK